ncbi:MAG: APC family permease [Pirellulales bacterium]
MSSEHSLPEAGNSGARAAQIVVVSSVMFTFISFWRTAAVVLCDMSSTVYYVGAIVENAIGKAAPWFILAVLLFSYMMRAVYIESCALFVRGGVYRIVKEALGGWSAKVAVSALLFDYVLTGPISGVSAGQYIIGLVLETLVNLGGIDFAPATDRALKSWGSVAIAVAVTLYFLRQNLLGIHESSGKALKIMVATTVMAVVMLGWSAATLAVRGPVNPIPSWHPDLSKKVEVLADGHTVPRIDPVTGEQQDPLGWLGKFPKVSEPLRQPTNWLSFIGAIGVVIAFGHSILAMSGEETLAQVYREVESPKLRNFKKVGFIVFAYSLILTGTMNFLCVMLIPDADRLHTYYDNWMGGLAMQMIGPLAIRLLLNAFVVVVGFLILSGAVNTSIVGSNGVLSRVAEDGVLPDWFLKPHPRLGTNYRLLYLITGLQLLTILASRGDVIVLGEAYAFGVVWSFVFNTMSMVVLRFKKRGPREFVVPWNIRVGDLYIPIGLSLVFLTVLAAALANLVTKPTATVGGLIFAGVFLTTFTVTEKLHKRHRKSEHHEHLEQFNRESVQLVTAASLSLSKPYRKLVAIRSPRNLFMLDKALADTDPRSTDVVVMTAKVELPGSGMESLHALDTYDQQLLTAVVTHAEQLGKTVTPLVVPTNNALHAVLNVAKDLPAQEVILGASNVFTAEEQLDQISLYWINLHQGEPHGLTVHIVGADRGITFDLHGGNRIPRAAERQAKTAADLRAAGIGIRRVLLVHDGTLASHDVFEWLITMVASDVQLDMVPVRSEAVLPTVEHDAIHDDQQRASKLGRAVRLLSEQPQSGADIVRLAREGVYDVLVLPWPDVASSAEHADASEWIDFVRRNSPCSVFLAAHPVIPREVVAS